MYHRNEELLATSPYPIPCSSSPCCVGCGGAAAGGGGDGGGDSGDVEKTGKH